MYGFKDSGIVELKRELGSYPPLQLSGLLFLLGKRRSLLSLGCAGALSFKAFIFLSVYRCPYP